MRLTKLAMFLSLTAAFPASAQILVDNSAPVTYYPQFFAALLSGLLLAFGFQLLLTMLSLALGLSATPNLMKAAARQKADSLTADDPHFADEYHAPHSDTASAPGMVTKGIGLWAILTSSIALFFASWCAAHLSAMPHDNTGIVLGLVIWAAFFMAMTYFEIKSVKTLIGGLIATAFSGLRASFTGLAGLVGPSPESMIERTARQTVRGLYEEVSGLVDKSDIGGRLEEAISRLKPVAPDYDRIVSELSALIEQIELEERTQVGDHEVSRIIDLHLGQKGDQAFAGHKAETLKKAARQAIHAVRRKSDAGLGGKAMAAAGALAGISRMDASAYRDKVTQFLARTGREELSPEALEADLHKIFDDPKAGLDVIRARLGLFDRDTLKSLAGQAGIEDEKAESLLGMAEKAFATLQEKYAGAKQQGGGSLDQATGRAKQVAGSVSDKIEEGRSALAGLPAAAEARIQAYFDGLERPELNYAELKSDLRRIFEDPSHAPAVLRDRLEKLDQASVVALLSSNSHISEEQAQVVVDKVLGARDAATGKIGQVTTEVNRRLETLRRNAVLTAEHARRNAIAASWWAFGTAVISGAASAAGGYVAGL